MGINGEKMRKTAILILVTGFTLLFLIFTPLWSQENKIKVGLLTPMAGSPTPDWGRKQTVDLQMAIDKVNQRGVLGKFPWKRLL